MPLLIRYNVDGSVETWTTPRQSKVAGITRKADQGTVATSQLLLPDPAGTHVLAGLRHLQMAESDGPTDAEVIYDGYLGPRDIGRDEEHIVGAQRLITVSLVDMNTLLTNYIIQGTKSAANGDRPEETDIERVQWLRTSAFMHNPTNDLGAIASTGGVLMDAADLRGQNAGNVLRDCGLISGRQWFLYYDESQIAANRRALFYNKTEAEVWSSALRFSNHPGDADDVRTAWGNMAALTFDFDSASPPVQHIKPDQIVSDVQIEYDGGTLFVTCEEVGLTTRADYYVKQLTVQAPNVKTEAGALRLATQVLRDHSTEETTASVQVLLPSTHVALIQPGHRVENRFDHFEAEFRDFTWWRVQELKWAQKSRKWYVVNLELEPIPAPPAIVQSYTHTTLFGCETGSWDEVPAEGDLLIGFASTRDGGSGNTYPWGGLGASNVPRGSTAGPGICNGTLDIAGTEYNYIVGLSVDNGVGQTGSAMMVWREAVASEPQTISWALSGRTRSHQIAVRGLAVGAPTVVVGSAVGLFGGDPGSVYTTPDLPSPGPGMWYCGLVYRCSGPADGASSSFDLIPEAPAQDLGLRGFQDSSFGGYSTLVPLRVEAAGTDHVTVNRSAMPRESEGLGWICAFWPAA